MKSRLKNCCLLVLALFIVTGCGNNMPNTIDVNNYQELIKEEKIEVAKMEEYNDDDIIKYIKDTFNIYTNNDNPNQRVVINNVNSKYPIKLLRKIDDMHFYTVYKTKQNGRAYVFFIKEQEELYAYFGWYYKKRIYSRDFDSLAVKKSTKSDVRKIDPFFVELYASGMPVSTSFHITMDNVLITIGYGNAQYESCEIVTEINEMHEYTDNIIMSIRDDDLP